jgi:hypothetical protein
MKHVSGTPLVQAISLDLMVTDIINELFPAWFQKLQTTINTMFLLKNTTFFISVATLTSNLFCALW